MKKKNTTSIALLVLSIVNLITILLLVFCLAQIKNLESIDNDIVQTVHELRVELIDKNILTPND